MPVNEAVLDLRAVEIVSTLESWREYAAEWRGWSRPATGGDVRRRIVVAARNLSMNLDSLVSEFPPVVDMAVELRELERSVLSVVGALPDRGRRIGRCVAAVAGGDVCGVPLYHRAGEPLTCPWCRSSYPPDTWLTLKHYQPQETG